MNDAWFFIVNPTAGGGKVKEQWKVIEKILISREVAFKFSFTQYRGHASELVEEAILLGFRKFVAVGGDGTNHEVVNGIFKQKKIPTRDLYYTLFPVGTGNDWARTYQFPKKIEEWTTMLLEQKVTYQDIGLVTYFKNNEKTKRYFVNVAGMAYDAFVVQATEKSKRKISNKFLYLIFVFRCLFKYRLREAKIIFDDAPPVIDKFYTINVGICKYSGGGMQLVPQANPRDGKLALTIARRVSKIGVLLSTPKFYNTRLGEHKAITLHTCQSVTVKPLEDLPTLLEADGEFLGEAPASFEVIPQSLCVVVPK